LALGGDPVVAPAIEIASPDSWTIADAALRRIGTYDWIAFTSANAVRHWSSEPTRSASVARS
jgi:uroporphyrinogen-III synthase